MEYGHDSPKGVAYDKEGYVLLGCVIKNLIALCLDHVTVGQNNGFFIEGFLLDEMMGRVLGKKNGYDGPDAPFGP